MKSIILAGGEGTRLRPISLNIPKPMVRLFDQPILTHTLNLLKQNGIEDACLTLGFLPHIITDHFGDGSAHGMRLTHHIEENPLGTAGSVAACADFIGQDPILILSGDAVCDFDLRQCIQFHQNKGADVTIVLYAHPAPLEYGLVMTDSDGRIERFIEKPPWNQVFTNRINTGIYILSPSVLQEIPANTSYDFARDLFPQLLASGQKLYGFEATGYWCDIGSPEAYLQCAIDALDNRLTLNLGSEQQRQGLWSHTPIPPGVTILEPCYIGKHVTLEPGARIGPHAILGANTHISAGAAVARSMVDGATLGPDTRLDGVIVGQNASLRRGSLLHEGSVIGDGTILGECSVVDPKVRIWPGKELPSGSRIKENLVAGQPRSGLRFSGGGAIRGETDLVITPEACLAIGSAIGIEGRVGVSYSGEAAAHLAARAIACGVSAVGGHTLELDAPFEAAASYAADLYDLPRTVFVREQDGTLHLKVYGPRGLPITRTEERKIESALTAGDLHRAKGKSIGHSTAATGTLEAYIASAASWGIPPGTPIPFAVEVTGPGAANRALKRTLERMNVPLATHGWGVPVFETAGGGMTLRAEDEEGHTLEPERLLAILVLLELESGAKAVAVPYAAPKALDHLAQGFNAKLLRLGRDKGAEDLYYRLPHLRDGVFAACRLVGAMATLGQSLHTISQRAPHFRTARREVPIQGDRAALMQALATTAPPDQTELIEGLRIPVASGWVHVSPATGRPVLKIHSESISMEAAEEICLDFAKRLEALDQI
ncbi:MAG: sugar phosphate nucleotidyltransferase [Oscillospiraceae bacterium]|nr:sugar phosphate nucleotidyltransferase [Oscillospiraceae bacterium]